MWPGSACARTFEGHVVRASRKTNQNVPQAGILETPWGKLLQRLGILAVLQVKPGNEASSFVSRNHNPAPSLIGKIVASI